MYCYKLSSDEFRIRLKIIRNSTNNVEFEIQIWGQIWSQNSNSTEFDGRIWSKLVNFDQIWSTLSENLAKVGPSDFFTAKKAIRDIEKTALAYW